MANAVAALSEIDETAKEDVFSLNTENLKMLLAALNECTEYALFLTFAWEPAKINGHSVAIEPSQALTARTHARNTGGVKCSSSTPCPSIHPTTLARRRPSPKE